MSYIEIPALVGVGTRLPAVAIRYAARNLKIARAHLEPAMWAEHLARLEISQVDAERFLEIADANPTVRQISNHVRDGIIRRVRA